MTCDFLGLKPGDTALLCMSLDYIAGKMMVVRALTCGLQLITVAPSGHPLHHCQFSIVNCQLDFAAMVPLQVWNSLQVPEECERLKNIRHLIIGGGAVDDALAAELRLFPHAVWSTYGMTETLSHIALRRLSGKRTIAEFDRRMQELGIFDEAGHLTAVAGDPSIFMEGYLAKRRSAV